jgi:chondroitin AC lyase
MQFIKGQFENTLATAIDAFKIPRTITNGGELVTVDIFDWTSGFFAGNLWYMYELTSDDKWKKQAEKWTEALDSVQYFSSHHDVGFMINCSYGNGLRLTGNKDYEKVMIQAAKSLSKRYSPVTKCIKSWDYRKAWDGKTEWFYPVIIDNMMNLELLFKATRLSGDSTFQKIAIQHALTTMKNHYRDDFSSFHVVDYDTITGQVLDKATCQGFVDGSSWARGQSWGLYGFTMCYRYTRDARFLKFAENIAGYILNHPNLPKDMVPFWDYNVVDLGLIPEWNYDPSKYPIIPRDASAAAITCSALFELSEYSKTNGERYYSAASKILESLSSPAYMAIPGNNKYFILNHSVGSIPHGVEIDVPLVYADYYFLEALTRKTHIE